MAAGMIDIMDHPPTIDYRSANLRPRSQWPLILMFAALIVIVVAAVVVPKFLV